MFITRGRTATWLLLVAGLPGQQGALRLRLWRALKAVGAATLRDGVYIAPELDPVSTVFREQLSEIRSAGGTGMLFTIGEMPPEEQDALIALFDRSAQYDKLALSVRAFVDNLRAFNESEARRSLRQLQRECAAIEATDFFRDPRKTSPPAEVLEAERAFNKRFSPDEPVAIQATVLRRSPSDFQGRVWATRSHLWVDRVCSAWLIRRFVDTQARFQWLKRVADCPKKAVGFDFDGATFTHIGNYVTFEVLLRSFALEEDAALEKLGALVHVLDVGGNRIAEAAGFEAVLTGARERCTNDDDLLDDMSRVLDDLYRAFSQAVASRGGAAKA
jgi:hypothetical protein